MLEILHGGRLFLGLALLLSLLASSSGFQDEEEQWFEQEEDPNYASSPQTTPKSVVEAVSSDAR